jgi:RNA polymerase sigma-70 factor (ECF subfamily)
LNTELSNRLIPTNGWKILFWLNFHVRVSRFLSETLQEQTMSEFPETDHSLVDRVKDTSDKASWLEFMGIYQPVVYRLARRRGMQDADAQDVSQQVFSSISRAIVGWQQSEDQPPFRAWLTTIARNAITTALMRRRPDRGTGSSSVADALDRTPDAEQTEEEVIIEARRAIVRWAAEQIRPEFTEVTWDIFWKTAMQYISVAEVSRSTGRSTGSIYVARHRVLSRLKEKIAEVSNHWEPTEKP